MVYLIGVDHLVQYDGPVPEPIRIEFRSYIIDVCRDLAVDVIAEEFSEEALHDVYNATAGTAVEASLMLGIRHRYCDPGEKELEALGIPYFGELLERAKAEYAAPPSYILDRVLREKVRSLAVEMAKTYWRKREEFWYERLREVLDMNIVFICGHEHVGRFMSVLAAHGSESKMVEPFWKKEIFTDYGTIGLT
ncbi:MAG: hypothetical protein KA369_07980 [Spirochaetes bacterium]|nr:hypothetical protein [Spirochaetota bacterium]